MPQVYNKDIARTGGGVFGKQSRFMSVYDSSVVTKRRYMAQMKMEKRYRERRLAVLERNTNITTSNLNRIARELKQSLLKTVAYKEVCKWRSFSKVEDKEERLNAKYTQYAMRYEIADQIKKLEPSYLRGQEAHNQIEKQRGFMDKIIQRNLRTILSPRARERKRLRRELNLDKSSTFTSSVGNTRPASEALFSRQNTKGLIVTKEQFKTKGGTPDVKTFKLPPINLNNKTVPVQNTETSTPKKAASSVKTDRPATGAKLVQPPIKQPLTVR